MTPVNGPPGTLFLDGEGRLLNVLALDILDGTVQAIRNVVNPTRCTTSVRWSGRITRCACAGRRTAVDVH